MLEPCVAMKHRRGKLRSKLALLAASLLLSLLVGEGCFRWRLSRNSDEIPKDDGEWRARYRRMNETLYMRSDVPGLVYEPRPNSSIRRSLAAPTHEMCGRASFQGSSAESVGALQLREISKCLI